jgi:threo-3-hydroxy-L-aspartate ammonia-lyase
MTDLSVSFEDILNASNRIQNAVHRTPVMTSKTADSKARSQLFFKCENFQRAGAFKFRGAYNALSQFTETQKEKGVIAYSSGNHAQAIALTAKILKMHSVLVMPKDAPSIKIEATRGYGAEIIFYDRYTENRESLGKKIAEEQGLTLIPPYDHPHIIAGQGTVAKELFEEVQNLDMLLVPLGGGGLLSGSAIAAKTLNPKCHVIGVEPEAGNDGQQSFHSGKIVHIETPKTIADGAQTQHLGEQTFPILQRYVDDILTVRDTQLVETMLFFSSRMKIIVEPTGCLAAAAALSNPSLTQGKRVGVILSGGNIDMKRFAELMSTHS